MDVIIFLMASLRKYMLMLMTADTPISIPITDGNLRTEMTLTWGMLLIGFTVFAMVFGFFKKLLSDSGDVVQIFRK